MAPPTDESVLRLGLIADIQYADIDDAIGFFGDRRRYRNALVVARAAVDFWNTVGVDAVVQLGDAIDGYNAQRGCGTAAALAHVLAELERCTARRRFDLVGNHELYNLTRSQLLSSGLHCFGPDGKAYRSEKLNERWQAIILDPFEVWTRGYDSPEDRFVQEAVEVLRKNNPQVLEAGRSWLDGVPEHLQRFTPLNGGASQEQVRWLDAALAAASGAGRKALVFTHVPLCCAASRPSALLWNADEILAVLHRHGDTVVAVFAGHDHDGGYAVDGAGLQHVTLTSPLGVADGVDDCCAVLDCYDAGWARLVASGGACDEDGRACGELILKRDAPGASPRQAGPEVLAM